MPLAFGSLLGGLTTLIGTPPNLLVSEAQRLYGLEPFRMFDYAPTGVVVMLAGTAFMVLVGRHLLPSRDIKDLSSSDRTDPGELFGLRERLFIIRLPADSPLGGRTLLQSRLSAALGLNVLAILRADENQLAPDPAAVLHTGDRLLVQGSPDSLTELRGRNAVVIEDDHLTVEYLLSAELSLAELELYPQSALLGQTLEQTYSLQLSIALESLERQSPC